MLVWSAAHSAWLERGSALPEGASLLQAEEVSKQIVLNFKSGHSTVRTIGYFVSRNLPINEIADLSNCSLFDRVRVISGSTVYIPTQNGTYYFAAVIYESRESNRQIYSFVPCENSLKVSWIPEFLAPPAQGATKPKIRVSMDSNFSNLADADKADTQQISPKANETNEVGTSDAGVQKNEGSKVTIMAMSDLYATGQTEKAIGELVSPMKELMLVVSNLLQQNINIKNDDLTNVKARERYQTFFTRELTAEIQTEIDDLILEMRGLYADFYTHRMSFEAKKNKALAISDKVPRLEAIGQRIDELSLLARYGNAGVSMHKLLLLTMEYGYRWGEVERLSNEYFSLAKETLNYFQYRMKELKSDFEKAN